MYVLTLYSVIVSSFSTFLQFWKGLCKIHPYPYKNPYQKKRFEPKETTPSFFRWEWIFLSTTQKKGGKSFGLLLVKLGCNTLDSSHSAA